MNKIDDMRISVSTNFDLHLVEITLPKPNIVLRLDPDTAMKLAQLLMNKAGWLKEIHTA